MDKPLDNPPPALKQLLPFVQRANELRTADSVIAYWCCYNAAQLGINSGASEKEAKLYLLNLMDSLESLKTKLSDNDAVTNDVASSAYIENFALKVFVGADNEDRAGKATRATAKKFLAASNFIDLLKIFGNLEPEMHEKSKYAKWKAADIAKAFREGRKPEPGPPGGDPKAEEASIENALSAPLDNAPVDKDEAEYLAREMAKLTSAEPPVQAQALSPSSEDNLEAPFNPADIPTRSRSASKARMSIHLDGSPLASPNFSKPLHPQVARTESQSGQSASESGNISPSLQPQKSDENPWGGARSDASVSPGIGLPPGPSGLTPPSSTGGATSPSLVPGGRPLPIPPPRDGLPIPPVAPGGSWTPLHSGQASPGQAPVLSPGLSPAGSFPPLASVPSAPPTAASAFEGSPSSPFPVIPSAPPGSNGQESIPTPVAPEKPPVQAQAPHPVAVQAVPPPSHAVPDALSVKLSSRVQKLARSAASAVDFDDLETARTQLRQALDILEGRALE